MTSPPTTGSSSATSSKASAPLSGLASSGSKLTSRASSTSNTQALAAAEKKEDDAVKLKEFVLDGGHFSLVRNFRLADVVTLGNGFCGALSLFSSANYLITADGKYIW